MSKIGFIAFSFLFWLGFSPTALLNITLTAIIFTAKNDGGIIREICSKKCLSLMIGILLLDFKKNNLK